MITRIKNSGFSPVRINVRLVDYIFQLSVIPMDRSYKQFLVVAELGNISQAATYLGLSQPTLTSSMKKLEASFDVPLFIRKSKGGVELTEYGQLLQEQALELQRRHDSLLHQMADLKERKTEKIKMGTGDAWWEVFVKQALQQYSTSNPSISIQLEFGNHLKLMDMLIHGQIDLFVGHEIIGLSRRCNVSFVPPLLQDKEASSSTSLTRCWLIKGMKKIPSSIRCCRLRQILTPIST